MTTVTYLIAFGGRPAAGFLPAIQNIAGESGIELKAVRVVPGPGCFNMALKMGENEAWINQLTMALMPAKWSTTDDEIPDGEFSITFG